MVNTDRHPGWGDLANKFLETGVGALRNRGELLLVEWQQEKARLIELLVLAIGLLFLGLMALLLLTATIIFLFPEEYRRHAAGGFTLLYLAGAVWAFFAIRSSIRQQPFAETLNQVKKDGEAIRSLR